MTLQVICAGAALVTRYGRIVDQIRADGFPVDLEVPSVVIPIESHYVINPVHGDFRRIRIGTPAPFVLDSHLARR